MDLEKNEMKRTFNDAFPDSDSDSDGCEEELSFCEMLEKAMARTERDHLRRPKGRQGRSRASRERAKRLKEESKKWDYMVTEPCEDCNRQDFLEDHNSGDVVCANCGLVASSKGLDFSKNILLRVRNLSKPYQRVVHFRQRFAQLIGIDPEIEEALLDTILDKIEDLKIPTPSFGKKDFSRVLKELNHPNFPYEHIKRLSANWIQIRRHLGESIPPEPEFPDELYIRLCARYQCIDRVFQETLWSPTGEKGKDNTLERRNIINVNYLTVQMLRLESEDLFRSWGKFLPQLTAKKQPGINNRRWKLLCEKLEGRDFRVLFSKNQEKISLKWEYKELTVEDIKLYCSGFH